MIYAVLKLYVKIALWFFYKEIDVRGLENIPEDAPVILAPNHQNAFMDAVIIACAMDRPIYSLTRAGVFKSAIASKLLSLLNMIPIYRFRDGLKEVKKNNQIIEKSLEILSQNKALLIFPEGNHSMKYNIRPLQKGIARIVLRAYASNIPVHVVPVGLYYDQHTAMRSRVLVQFGKSMVLDTLVDQENEHQQSNYAKFLSMLSNAMKKLTLHIPEDRYDEVFQLWSKLKWGHSTINDQYTSDQEIIDKIASGDVSPHPKKKDLNKLYWLLSPITIYGVINHLLAYLLLHMIIVLAVKDDHFLASMKLALGMIIVPLCYVAQLMTLHWLGVELTWLVLYAVSLPVSGVVAGDCRRRFFSKSAVPA